MVLVCRAVEARRCVVQSAVRLPGLRMREDLERNLQALVTESTLRQAESVASILPDVAADRRGRALGAAASWSRRSVCAGVGPVPGRLGFALPAIADTRTVRRRAGRLVAAP